MRQRDSVISKAFITNVIHTSSACRTRIVRKHLQSRCCYSINTEYTIHLLIWNTQFIYSRRQQPFRTKSLDMGNTFSGIVWSILDRLMPFSVGDSNVALSWRYQGGPSPSTVQNFLNFMQFFGNFTLAPPESWRPPPLPGLLDLPLFKYPPIYCAWHDDVTIHFQVPLVLTLSNEISFIYVWFYTYKLEKKGKTKTLPLPYFLVEKSNILVVTGGNIGS